MVFFLGFQPQIVLILFYIDLTISNTETIVITTKRMKICFSPLYYRNACSFAKTDGLLRKDNNWVSLLQSLWFRILRSKSFHCCSLLIVVSEFY